MFDRPCRPSTHQTEPNLFKRFAGSRPRQPSRPSPSDHFAWVLLISAKIFLHLGCFFTMWLRDFCLLFAVLKFWHLLPARAGGHLVVVTFTLSCAKSPQDVRPIIIIDPKLIWLVLGFWAISFFNVSFPSRLIRVFILSKKRQHRPRFMGPFSFSIAIVSWTFFLHFCWNPVGWK